MNQKTESLAYAAPVCEVFDNFAQNVICTSFEEANAGTFEEVQW